MGTDIEALIDHIKNIHITNKTFSCSKCDFKTGNTQDLRLHIIDQHLKNDFSCDRCDFKSKEKSELISHINTLHANTE